MSQRLQSNSLQLAGLLILTLRPVQGTPDLLGAERSLQLDGLLNLLW